MNETLGTMGDPPSAYDQPIVGLSFHTNDPGDPIAGFGEQVGLPIPDVGETVGISNEDLDDPQLDNGTDGERTQYRVLERAFEYRAVDYDGFSGEGRRQVVVVVNVEVEPIPTD